MSNGPQNGRLALLVGGGPAPGINGVICAATIEARNNGLEVIGFQDGFRWLMQGDDRKGRPLDIADVKDYALRGGSILGTSRDNPAKSEAAMAAVLGVLRRLEVTALVTIGGDDTAFSASQVYKQAGGAIRVAHVPKTIDNDLPLPDSTPTFGFETARHLGAAIVRNLAEDARTTSRWYLVVSMGRAAADQQGQPAVLGSAAHTVSPWWCATLCLCLRRHFCLCPWPASQAGLAPNGCPGR